MKEAKRPSVSVSNRQIVVGRVLSFFGAAFLLFDGIGKIVKPQPVMEATLQLGFPERAMTGIGAALIISTILYLIPRASVFGMIFLTGYLGGAVAIHVRADSGVFPVLFPVILATLLWAGLVLRRPLLRRCIFPEKTETTTE